MANFLNALLPTWTYTNPHITTVGSADDQPQEEGWCISAILGIAKWAPPSGVPFARSWCQTLDCKRISLPWALLIE